MANDSYGLIKREYISGKIKRYSFPCVKPEHAIECGMLLFMEERNKLPPSN